MSILKPRPGQRLNTDHPLADGLVGSWLFNENGGTLVHDTSGNGNTGTLTNMDPATDWVAGLHGPALDFDGTNDHIKLSADINMNGWSRVSVVCGFSSDGSGSNEHTLVNNWSTSGAGVLIRIEPSDNTVEVFMRTAGGQIGGTFSDLVITANKYHDLAVCYDGTIKAYLDGKQSATTFSGNQLASVDSGDLEFAASETEFPIDDYLVGTMSYVHILETCLSFSQVNDLRQDPFQMYRRRDLPLIVAATSGGGAPPTTTPFFYNQLLKRRYA